MAASRARPSHPRRCGGPPRGHRTWQTLTIVPVIGLRVRLRALFPRARRCLCQSAKWRLPDRTHRSRTAGISRKSLRLARLGPPNLARALRRATTSIRRHLSTRDNSWHVVIQRWRTVPW